LVDLADPKSEATEDELCELLTAATMKSAVRPQDSLDSGLLTDYLDHSGYKPHINNPLIKQMVLAAIPIITRENEYTPEHVKEALVRSDQVMMNAYSTSLQKRERERRIHLQRRLVMAEH
jgi:hypothetical protein